jgi:glutamyl-tRNA synthetase
VARYQREEFLRPIKSVVERCRTTLELAERVAMRLEDAKVKRDEKADQLIAKDPEGFRGAIEATGQRLAELPESDWQPEKLEAELRTLAESLGVAVGKIFQPIRVALVGGTVSEPVHDLLWGVGKKRSLDRLQNARSWG